MPKAIALHPRMNSKPVVASWNQARRLSARVNGTMSRRNGSSAAEGEALWELGRSDIFRIAVYA
jgi:hypothetical protein